jgi:hypothetical protein
MCRSGDGLGGNGGGEAVGSTVVVRIAVEARGMGRRGDVVVGSTSMAAGVLVVGASAAGIVGDAWLASPPSLSSEEEGDGGTISRTEKRRGGEDGGARGASFPSVFMLCIAVVGWKGVPLFYCIRRRGRKKEKAACALLFPCVQVLCVCLVRELGD